MPFQHVSSVKSFEIIASLVVFVFCLGNTLSWPYSLVILNPQGPGTAYVTCIYCFLFCSVSACVIYFSFFSFTKCRVIEHHVDGFRWDLASVLCRGTNGSPLDAPPLVWVRGFFPVWIYICQKWIDSLSICMEDQDFETSLKPSYVIPIVFMIMNWKNYFIKNNFSWDWFGKIYIWLKLWLKLKLNKKIV